MQNLIVKTKAGWGSSQISAPRPRLNGVKPSGWPGSPGPPVVFTTQSNIFLLHYCLFWFLRTSKTTGIKKAKGQFECWNHSGKVERRVFFHLLHFFSHNQNWTQPPATESLLLEWLSHDLHRAVSGLVCVGMCGCVLGSTKKQVCIFLVCILAILCACVRALAACMTH